MILPKGRKSGIEILPPVGYLGAVPLDQGEEGPRPKMDILTLGNFSENEFCEPVWRFWSS